MSPPRNPFVGLTIAQPVPVPANAASTPDAELITACNEYLRILRAFEAYYLSFPGDIEGDDPAWAKLDPLTDLEETIVRLRATTPEGHVARARCWSFNFLPHHSACQDEPDGASEDRFKAAALRDLVHAERGGVV